MTRKNMTTEYFAVIVNSPADGDGKFQQQVRIVDRYQWHGVRNGVVLWDTRTMGDVRLRNPETGEFLYLPLFFVYVLEGVSTRVYSGVNNSIPYINEGADWLDGHRLWMIDNYRYRIDMWAVKAFLYELPDGGSNKLVAMNAIIEATYTATPLNKVRWEEREFMNWGDVLYLMIQEELGMSHHELYQNFQNVITVSYNEYTDIDIT